MIAPQPLALTFFGDDFTGSTDVMEVLEWAARLQGIAEHHRVRLEEMVAAVVQPSTVAEISRQVFNHDRLSTHEVRFAVTETLAHLCYLVEDGRLAQDTGADGVMCFGRG